jgi:hypothetical protein
VPHPQGKSQNVTKQTGGPLHIRFKRLVVAIVSAVGLSLGLLGMLGPTAAHAATLIDQPQACYQYSCDGLDPSFSFEVNTSPHAYCADGSSPVYGVNILGGYLELRWGPNCQTNWARFTPGDNDLYHLYVERDDNPPAIAGNGLGRDYIFSGAQGVTQYTDQVYSPGPARLCVDDVTFQASACYDQATNQLTVSPAV